MNRQELNRYIKHTQSTTVVIMQCKGQLKGIRLPEEIHSFMLNDEVIMKGPLEVISDWLIEHVEQLTYYRIEYERKRNEKPICAHGSTIQNKVDSTTFISKDASIKQNVTIDTKTVIMAGCVIGPNVRIGESCTIHESCIISGMTKGESKPTIIGNRVYIEEDVIVLSGVKVGNDVTIKSGSIVTCDISEGLVVAGVPAKMVDHRTVKPTMKERN